MEGGGGEESLSAELGRLAAAASSSPGKVKSGRGAERGDLTASPAGPGA